MLHEDRKEERVSVWEAEGGNTGLGPGRINEERALPTLPPGCTAQQVWGFADPSGRLYYEFYRVYHPETVYRDGAHLVEDRLDPDLCYWTVTWTGRSREGDEYPAARWIDFKQARRLHTKLDYEQFSTNHNVALPALLHIEDIELPPLPRFKPLETRPAL